MSLNFPNPSRSYEPDHARVRFWGHDSSMEVAFFLSEDALFRLAPDTAADETAILEAFDANRARIMDTARKAYTGRRTHSFILGAAIFTTDRQKARRRRNHRSGTCSTATKSVRCWTSVPRPCRPTARRVRARS